MKKSYSELESENKRLRRYLKSLQRDGTSFDLNPTMIWDSEDKLHIEYLNYIKRMDDSIKLYAKETLE